MWARLFSPALPTPLHSEDVARKNIRGQPPGEDENDAHSPLPRKKRAHHSMLPVLDKYKRHKPNDDELSMDRFRDRRYNQASPSPVPESPMIEELKRNYAALRVSLHSKAVKDVATTEKGLVAQTEENINDNLSKLCKIDAKARQLCASSLDCEVDTQISNKEDQQRIVTVQVRNALSRYQDIEAKRSEQLAQLWEAWETAQADVEALSSNLHELFDRERANGTSGMSSSNRECSDQEDLDIGRRSKQVVEDMASCEEEFHEKLKDEETNVLEAMLKCSLG
ncbi:hypothetical protein GGR50DRAFT_694392 [Xylaria sp. CBS 124048]|nr:hypothetical protein GGR50DRAFT_694392 [Xylaria sp. CBS 124048]